MSAAPMAMETSPEQDVRSVFKYIKWDIARLGKGAKFTVDELLNVQKWRQAAKELFPERPPPEPPYDLIDGLLDKLVKVKLLTKLNLSDPVIYQVIGKAGAIKKLKLSENEVAALAGTKRRTLASIIQTSQHIILREVPKPKVETPPSPPKSKPEKPKSVVPHQDITPVFTLPKPLPFRGDPFVGPPEPKMTPVIQEVTKVEVQPPPP